MRVIFFSLFSELPVEPQREERKRGRPDRGDGGGAVIDSPTGEAATGPGGPDQLSTKTMEPVTEE